MNRKTRRSAPAINAGSMADIAFLLLIFFLVATQILSDSGIMVRLPVWSDVPPEDVIVKQRNLARVAMNANDQLVIRDQPVVVDEVKNWMLNFISNPTQDPDMAEQPDKVLISLINDRGTSYEMYLSVYNEIKAAYTIIWNRAANERFGYDYAHLPMAHQRSIREEYPFTVSEAEPTDHGE